MYHIYLLMCICNSHNNLLKCIPVSIIVIMPDSHIPNPDKLFTLTNPGKLFTLANLGKLFTLPNLDKLLTLPNPDKSLTLANPDKSLTWPNPVKLFTLPNPDKLFTLHNLDNLFSFPSRTNYSYWQNLQLSIMFIWFITTVIVAIAPVVKHPLIQDHPIKQRACEKTTIIVRHQ